MPQNGVTAAHGPHSLAGAPAPAAARPADAPPRPVRAGRIVQICHKGPDRAGAREKNR